MGYAADLFYSSDTERETLHRRITPTDEQSEDQKTRWNDLATFLKERLKEDAALPNYTWLQGSYKFATQIRPHTMGAEFDIDLGFYFIWKGKPEDGNHDPEDLKAFVQQALIDYQADEENDASSVDEPKERCNRIRFNPDFHIDVPCYHLDRSEDARALATQSGAWEDSDPKAIYQWFKKVREPDVERAQLRRQVRYLKMWAALKFEQDERPSSILLTVLAADALEEFEIAGVDDDDLLEHVSLQVCDRLKASTDVPNPVDTAENLNRLDDEATSAFVEGLDELVDIAGRAGRAPDAASAAEIWAEAFGQFFPMPEDNDESGTNALSEGARSALAVLRFDPQIHVVARPNQNPHRYWEGHNELPRIPKDCSLTFTLLNNDRLPPGARLRWTVRNRGDEAASLNDLGHASGDDVTIEERSSYNGDHAMDLAVYLGSQIIGRRRVLVQVRGPAIPARNPPRRRYGR